MIFSLLAPQAACSSAQREADVAAVTELSPPPPPPPSPWVPPDLSPADRALHLADAEAQLAAAERAVDEQLSRARTAPKPPPLEATNPTPLGSEPAEGCPRACVALTSMVRSVEHLCRLAGPQDARCIAARARADRAAARVRNADCACDRE